MQISRFLGGLDSEVSCRPGESFGDTCGMVQFQTAGFTLIAIP